jgi:hypothetical protein
MTRKIWTAFVLAVSFSLHPSTAEAQTEEDFFPYDAEATADEAFNILSYASCSTRFNSCMDACRDQFIEESAVCLVTILINPLSGLLCAVAADSRLFRCVDKCERQNIDCLVRGGGSAGGGPLDLDPGDGSGGDCGLSAEYANPC